jgi:hypothetical protein
MVFQHSPSPKHPEVIASYCPLCGMFVGASFNPEILALIERIHQCPALRKKRAFG